MSIFQTPEWEEFKLKTGYSKSYWVDGILVLQKQLPLGWSMLYSPMLSQDQKSKIKNQKLISKIKNIAATEKSIFYRAELDEPITESTSPQIHELTSLGFAKAFEEMQPEHTLILDIDRTEEKILAQMKPKGRYNIKIAERSGIVIEKTDTVREFFRLYQTMAKRQNITYRNEQYFQNLVDILKQKGYCQVFLAQASESLMVDSVLTIPEDSDRSTINNKPSTVLASAIVCYYGDRATYLFGGSSREHRELMAPYKLHWEIIKDAKARGLKEYDFFGIAPDDNPKHPWAGVTRFKKQFGGRQVDLLGSYDLVFNKTKYQLFKLAEKVRRS